MTTTLPRGSLRNPKSGNPTWGPLVCQWISTNLVHGPGDFQGQFFRITPEERDFFLDLYEFDLATGNRIYRRVLKGLPKGNGKTEIAAAVGCVELALKPFSKSPDIPVAAASFEQADLLFGAMRVMIGEGPQKEKFEVFDTQILEKNGPGRAYRVAAAAGTNDGGKPTCLLADEIHEWTGSKERVHLVLSNGLSKRANALELNITTAGWDDDSLLYRLYDYGKRIEAGELDDPTFLFDWLEAPGDADLSTEEGLRAAILSCNPAADVFWPLENLVRRFKEIPEFEYRRYHLNQWTTTDEIWIPQGAWDACRSDLELDPTLPTRVGIDVGIKHDSSAVVVAQNQDGRTVVRCKVWENPHPPGTQAHAGWKLDIVEIENYLRELYDLYTAPTAEIDDELLPGPEFNYDPHFFERSAQSLVDDGLAMVEFPQNNARMIPACQNLYEMVLDGQIAHNGDEQLKRHVHNAVAVQKERGWRLDKLNNKRKIDALIALAIAAYRAQEEPPEEMLPEFALLGD